MHYLTIRIRKSSRGIELFPSQDMSHPPHRSYDEGELLGTLVSVFSTSEEGPSI